MALVPAALVPAALDRADDALAACHHGAVSASSAVRTRADGCPGLLRPHRAADGAVVRLRLPGGVIAAAALSAVSAAAAEFGDGHVQLTSRGNLQLRGVPVDVDGEVPGELVDRIAAAGLIPSASHELVRNIACSPLTGRLGGVADLRMLTTELDELICATPELAGLPGRFLFGLDDGTSDIAGLQCDLGVRAVSVDRVALVIADIVGPMVELSRAAAALVALSSAFLRARTRGPGAEWHVADLPDRGQGLWVRLSLPPPDRVPAELWPERPVKPPRYGSFRQFDGRTLLSFAVPLGLLTPEQVSATVATASTPNHDVIVTPWRGLVIPDLDVAGESPALDGIARRLAAAGLTLDPGTGWRGVSACTGAPGCGNAAAPTRSIAALLAESRQPRTALPVHVIACERRCGSPADDHIEVLLDPSSFSMSRRAAASVVADLPDSDHLSALPDRVSAARNEK